MKKILVCGGRDFDDFDLVCKCLDAVNKKYGISLIIHGNANGADLLSSKWATLRKVKQLPFHANWDLYGNKAGPIRNSIMLKEGKPDAVIAFKGGKGTLDMIKKAENNGLIVWRL